MEDGIDGSLSDGFFSKWTSRIQIPVVPGEIAAGDFDTQAVTCQEHLGGGRHVYFKPVDPARRHQFGALQGVSESRPQDAVADGHGTAVRPDVA